MIESVTTGTVYEIYNRQSGDRYVGSTRGNVIRRWGLHINSLNQRKHHNPLFQQSWNDSVFTEWMFRVLEHEIAPENLAYHETDWIRRLNPNLNIDRKSKAKNTDKIETTLRLRRDGVAMRDIAAQVDMSLGWVASTCRRYRLSA